MAGLGSSLTDTSTTLAGQLGREFTEPASASKPGDRVWIYVHNDSGADLAVGEICVFDAGTSLTDYKVSACAATDEPPSVVGVAQHAIVDGSYGWIQKRGVATILADGGGLAAGDAIICGAAGAADGTTTTTTAAIGFALEQVVLSTTGEVLLTIP